MTWEPMKILLDQSEWPEPEARHYWVEVGRTQALLTFPESAEGKALRSIHISNASMKYLAEILTRATNWLSMRPPPAMEDAEHIASELIGQFLETYSHVSTNADVIEYLTEIRRYLEEGENLAMGYRPWRRRKS